MSIPLWPSNLPQELFVDGYEESPGSNTLRSQPDVGPAKVRRRATCAPREIAGNVLLTEAQLSSFKSFYNDTLMSGSLRFQWNDPTAPGTVEMRFAEKPSWVPRDISFLVSMSLEILP